MISEASTLPTGSALTASEVRVTPYTTHGCRPTSATHQPVSTAMKPEGIIATHARRYQGFSSVPRRQRHRPISAKPSIAKPRPTMMRNEKNGSFTGGRWSAGKSFRPFTSPCRLWVRMMLPSRGTSTA